jgi:hypothetical protein
MGMPMWSVSLEKVMTSMIMRKGICCLVSSSICKNIVHMCTNHFIYVFLLVFLDNIRKSLLITRCFLSSRKLTSANVSIDVDLIDQGFNARALYQQQKRKMAAQKAASELAKQSAMEEQILREKILADQQRQKRLDDLGKRQQDNVAQKRKADQEQMDAELEVQRALHKLAEKTRLLQILMQMEQHY